LAQTGQHLRNCRVAIVSTMPLSATLARQGEALIAAPVLEIYGSTETGVLAMRRTAMDSAWRAVQGVSVKAQAEATIAIGTHFDSPARLTDRIEPQPDGSFALIGRHSDMIKIAGRRASLDGLNAVLQGLPALHDGVLHLPSSDNPTERLCLIYAGPKLDREATERWLRTRIDAAFLPRRYIQVAQLPRSAAGKLPRHALDRICAQHRQPAPLSMPFEISIASDHPALPGHFPGRPIVPGVLLLDQLTRHVAAALDRPVIGLLQVKFSASLLPDEIAHARFECSAQFVAFEVHATRQGQDTMLASGRLDLSPQAGGP
jgi:3-hydroxymyristoyl/3-hydroxydecanoyl-(acyl carrier protein) dehydratase